MATWFKDEDHPRSYFSPYGNAYSSRDVLLTEASTRSTLSPSPTITSKKDTARLRTRSRLNSVLTSIIDPQKENRPMHSRTGWYDPDDELGKCIPTHRNKSQEILQLTLRLEDEVDKNKTLQSTLQVLQGELVEKSREIEEFKVIVGEYEYRARSQESFPAQSVMDLLQHIGSNSKLDQEVRRLRDLLDEGHKKLDRFKKQNQELEKALKHCHCKRPASLGRTNSDSKEFYINILEQNKSLSEQLNSVKTTLSHTLTSLLSSLALELSTIRMELMQITSVMQGFYSGEELNLELLLTKARVQGQGERGDSYSEECMKAVEGIKAELGKMRGIASDFYADHCGKICNLQ